MILDYGTLLSDEPIELSIGTIKIPKLRDIRKLGFSHFNSFEVYMKLTPEEYYTKLFKDDEQRSAYWESLPEEQRENMTIYNVILLQEDAASVYLEMFNFFFEEMVIFRSGVFVLLKGVDRNTPTNEIVLSDDNIRSVINEKVFDELLDIFQQICNIKDYDEDEEPPKFKNEKAKRLWERMLKAQKEAKKRKAKENNINLTLPNIISSVAAKSNNLNIIDIWNTTLFQLYDQFNRLQLDDSHYINAVRVAVWGDEKNKFNSELWHINTFEKKLK